MSLKAAASGLVVFLLSVQVVQGLDGWGVTYSSPEICAVKGSTVEIRCSFTYPSTWKGSVNTVKKTFWFTKKKDGEPVDLTTDAQYAGRVEDRCGNNRCTLRIRNLTESDSAEYRFRIKTSKDVYAGEPVTLSLTDLSVQVESKDSNRANLKCQSSCDLPGNDYVWYKNGGKIQTGTSSLQVDFNYLDSYSCALKGFEDSLSPSVCVTGQNSNTVTSIQGSICAPRGSSVDISCRYSSNDCITSKFWFSPERSHQGQIPSQPEDLSEDTHYAARVQILDTERGRSTLRISDLRDSDSAQYLFTFKTPSFEWRSDLPGTTLTVTALQVQVITETYRQSHTYAELKCHSSCGPAAGVSYVWFKNNEKIGDQTRSSYKDWIQPADMISCAFEGHEKFRSPAVCECTELQPVNKPSRKRSSKPTTEAGERPDNDAQVRMYDRPSAEVQNATPEPEAEVCYASVRFIKNQDDALYSNTKPAHLRRHKTDEKDTEEDVVYSTVTFKDHSATAESERHEAAEDPSALYSVVNKKPRVLT
ncbi:hypothetical protein KUCAC02_031730 [Chaenocephalus aceratus]|nr:hypothetical protein KUCAC02_031730 [Chaenocephalus aceratus]